MTEQGSFFHPDDYKNAWTKEESQPGMDELRAQARNRQLERVRAHNAIASNRVANGFHDRRQEPGLTVL